MSKEIKKEIMSWIKTFTISVIMAMLILQVIQPTIVKEVSMLPTLEPNNYLVLEKISSRMGKLERGDIIVFKTEMTTEDGKEKNLIKRIVGLPGDHIVIYAGKVVVNEELLQEEYLSGAETEGSVDLIVDEGKIFVMGDNRKVSLDSRSPKVGLIDMESIIGRAMVRLYPFDEIRNF
ncbi:MAG TPA: signal peptidase I [Clostridia bacterium]|nr:signal peptidase I [Clostridia bacterium]